jgi:hypothetical protein
VGNRIRGFRGIVAEKLFSKSHDRSVEIARNKRFRVSVLELGIVNRKNKIPQSHKGQADATI